MNGYEYIGHNSLRTSEQTKTHILSCMSFMKIKKKGICPRTDPCGTPDKARTGSEA